MAPSLFLTAVWPFPRQVCQSLEAACRAIANSTDCHHVEALCVAIRVSGCIKGLSMCQSVTWYLSVLLVAAGHCAAARVSKMHTGETWPTLSHCQQSRRTAEVLAGTEAEQRALVPAVSCQLCGGPAMLPHRNCANLDCNRLFVACDDCTVRARHAAGLDASPHAWVGSTFWQGCASWLVPHAPSPPSQTSDEPCCGSAHDQRLRVFSISKITLWLRASMLLVAHRHRRAAAAARNAYRRRVCSVLQNREAIT